MQNIAIHNILNKYFLAPTVLYYMILYNMKLKEYFKASGPQFPCWGSQPPDCHVPHCLPLVEAWKTKQKPIDQINTRDEKIGSTLGCFKSRLHWLRVAIAKSGWVNTIYHFISQGGPNPTRQWVKIIGPKPTRTSYAKEVTITLVEEADYPSKKRNEFQSTWLKLDWFSLIISHFYTQ